MGSLLDASLRWRIWRRVEGELELHRDLPVLDFRSQELDRFADHRVEIRELEPGISGADRGEEFLDDEIEPADLVPRNLE